MNLEELAKLMKERIKIQMEQEVSENPCAQWPEDIGTKAWFQKYATSINEYACRPGQMSPQMADTVHKDLAKFDPKFAELCKRAHDSAIDFMNYTKSKMESR